MTDHLNNHENEQGFPFDQNGKNPFSMPEGYFDSFAKKLNDKIELEEELKSFKILNSLKKESPFQVPEHYFETAFNRAEYAQELVEFPVLSQLSKPDWKIKNALYFKNLPDQILYRIELENELKEFKQLSQIHKVSPYQIPVHYFDSLADKIKEQVYFKQNHVSISIWSKILDHIFGAKLAYAFTVLLIAGLFSIWNLSDTNSGTHKASDCNTLACLDKHELLNDKNLQSLSEENLLEMVDVEKLNQQITKDIKQNNKESNPAISEEYLLENVNTDQLLEEL